jgi:3-oxoisoapionate kinase
MRQHPTTPMDEADLRVHLSRQTRLRIGLMSLLNMEGADAGEQLEALLAQGNEGVLFDALEERHLVRVGELVWRKVRRGCPLFAVGSSGLEYGLIGWWRRCGVLRAVPWRGALRPTERLVVVSGSCSPVTERQVGRALARGFLEVGLDTVGLVQPGRREEALERALAAAGAGLVAGRSVIFHTARGPGDVRLRRTSRRLAAAGGRSAEVLGSALGELLERVLERVGRCRAVVTGGDTSGFAARALGVEALEFVAPVAPGAPLCRMHAPGRVSDGGEIVFKGGQNGRDDFFLTLKDATGTCVESAAEKSRGAKERR